MGFVTDDKPLSTDEADTPSPWLRSWIEFQVDARVNQAVRDLITRELTKAASSNEVHAGADRMQAELHTLAQNQAALLQVVEGISTEMAEAGERITRHQQELMDVSSGVQQVESKLSVWRTEVAAEVRASAMRDKGDSESFRLEAQAAASARSDFEERLESLRLEVVSATRSWTDFERRMEHGHRLLVDRLDNSHRKLAERTESWMEGMGQDLHARENRLTAEMRQGLRKDALAEIRSELRLELDRDLGDRILRQQEAVLGLEEQLWLVDRRLGARIEEMAHKQIAIDNSVGKDGQRRGLSQLGNKQSRGSISAVTLPKAPEHRAAIGMLAAAVEALQDEKLETEDGLAASSAGASEVSSMGAAGMQRSRSAGRTRSGGAWRGRLTLDTEKQHFALEDARLEEASPSQAPSADLEHSEVPTRASFLALETLAASLQEDESA